MDRARELRSKIKDWHDQHGTGDFREIQRQRRVRQLEETQRLLDQFADPPVSSDDSVRSAKVTVGIDAHVASPMLGRGDRCETKQKSTDLGDSVLLIPAESRSVQEMSRLHHSERIGRGRGRGGNIGGSGTSSHQEVGSLLQRSKLFPPRDVAEYDRQQRHEQDRKLFSTSNDGQQLNLQCYYLEDRRIPEQKDGECDKLVVLRQRLATRRRMRERILEGKNGEKTYRVKSDNGPREVHSIQPHPKQPRAGRDNDESNRSCRSSSNNDATQTNASTESGSIISEKSVVDIELIKCHCCGRSFAPKIYKKHFDSDGQPKCERDNQRPVFNSAKARIANNSNFNQDEQMQVLQMNKKVTKDLEKKKSGKGRSMEKRRSSKWREESRAFREAMKASRL